MNILFKNIRIISPEDGLDTVSDLHIQNGIITKIGEVKNTESEVIDGSNLICAPGFFDMHVHFRDPGQTYKEDLISGTASAMNGGFTGVLCMPNTKPPVDTTETVKYITEYSNNCLVDVYTSACVTSGRAGLVLSNFKALADAGAKAFTDDGSPVQDSDLMLNALMTAAKFNIPVLQHSEDTNICAGGVMNEGKTAEKLGLKGMPKAGETAMLARDIDLLSRVENASYHIQHISCGKSVALVNEAKKNNLKITAEVCPHHFVLTDDKCIGYNTDAKMNPPLRNREDISEILEGLNNDTVDVICTDHAPHSQDEKNKEFNNAPFGIVGLETCLGLSITYLINEGIINLAQLIQKLSINPRKILNIKTIRIREGCTANLTIFNQNSEWTVDKTKFMSKSRNTPFEGFHLKGKPFCVINKGKIFKSDL